LISTERLRLSEEREKAFPYPGIKSVLQEILEVGKTRVVIVSGRDATELIPLLAIEPHLEVWDFTDCSA